MPPKIKKTITMKEKPWTQSHIERYRSLYNNLIKTPKYSNWKFDSYIEDHSRIVEAHIRDNPDWAIGTKELYMFMIARYLYTKKKYRKSKRFSELGHDYTKQNDAMTGQNRLDDKELENFRTHEYFLNIISTFNEPTTKKEHMKQLLLKLLVYQPPLRTSFYTSCLIAKDLKDNNGEDNYVYISRRGKGSANYIVNNDKVSNAKAYSMDKTLKKISLSQLATDSLIESVKKYPRKYLFETKNEEISQKTLLNWLRDITNTPKINIDMMRSSYVTWFHGENKEYASRSSLARKMRHSQSTASMNYNKILEGDITSTNIDCVETKQKLVISDLRVKELEEMISGYSKDKTDMKLFSKRRSDVLYNLNVKKRTPRADTLKKYGIVQDKDKFIIQESPAIRAEPNSLEIK